MANCTLPTIKNPILVLVWRCTSAKKVGRLNIIRKAMNSKKYLNVHINKMLPSATDMLGDDNFIFQGNNALCHSSKIVKE